MKKISELSTKVTNGGLTERGRLSADEYNTILGTVQDHDKTISSIEEEVVKNCGYFMTVEALQHAYPKAGAGSKAYVGASYPYAIYLWNTASSAWVNSGATGGEENVKLGDYYTKENVDEKVAELESEVISSGVLQASFNIVGGINADGTDSGSTDYCRTPYYNITTVSEILIDVTAGSTSWCTLACYDGHGVFMAEESLFGTQKQIYQIPNNVAQIRLSCQVAYTSKYAKFAFISDGVTDNAITIQKLSDDLCSIINNNGILFYKDAGVGYANGEIGFGISTNRKITGYIKVSKGDIFNYDVLVGSPNWAAIAAYDANKTYIQSESVAGSSEATTPSKGIYIVRDGVKYIIFTGLATYENKVQAELVANVINTFGGEIAIEQLGGIAYDTGEDANNAQYVRSEYIPVSENDIIECNLVSGSAWWGLVALYDSDKAYIKDGSISGTSANIKLTIPKGVAYIRVSCSKDYADMAAYKNKVLRVNELSNELGVPDYVNTVSLLKYPNLLEQKGCLAIQMDLGNMNDGVSGHKEMLNVLREYGIMSMDFAINITALQSDDVSWLKKVQMEGCEIIYHNRINTISDVSSNSTLSVEQAKEGVCKEKLAIAQVGLTTFGMVANNGNIGLQFQPMINKLFFWSEINSGQIMTTPKKTTKAQYQADHLVFRTGFDMRHDVHSAQAETDMINAGKLWIDSLIADQSMGVLYCHYYNRPNVDDYGLYECVLRAMAAYIVVKINNGELYYGTTTECLNYLCR